MIRLRRACSGQDGGPATRERFAGKAARVGSPVNPRAMTEPKSSRNDAKRQRKPRQIGSFKNHAKRENGENREIREIRETGKLAGDRSGFLAYFGYFAVENIA